MTLILYYHPFSSYCQKALLALYEKGIAFEPYKVDLGDPRQRAEFAAIWPYAKFPVLHDIDAGVTIPEASLICDYVDGLPSNAPRLVPQDPEAARRVRILDRVLDNYLNTPLGRIVGDRLRPEDQRDPTGVAQERALIATTYDVLEKGLADVGWLGGADFSLADCAAAPPLFYTARLVPLDGHRRLAAYLERAMARPSFKRCLDDARGFRPFFPADPRDAGWPDEDDRLAF
jgi:glutathione S-transferase